MLVYKIDVLDSLREAGYTSHILRRDDLISQSALQKLRHGEMVGIHTLAQLCKLLDMQPGNIIKYVDSD